MAVPKVKIELSVFEAYQLHKPTQQSSMDELMVIYFGRHGAKQKIYGIPLILVTNIEITSKCDVITFFHSKHQLNVI